MSRNGSWVRLCFSSISSVFFLFQYNSSILLFGHLGDICMRLLQRVCLVFLRSSCPPSGSRVLPRVVHVSHSLYKEGREAPSLLGRKRYSSLPLTHIHLFGLFGGLARDILLAAMVATAMLAGYVTGGSSNVTQIIFALEATVFAAFSPWMSCSSPHSLIAS